MLHFGRWKLLTIFLVVLAGALYTLPNLVPETVRYQINEADGSREPRGIWRYIPSSTINLGLDLQGGSYIVFEVDMNEVRTAQLESLAADVRQTLRNDPPLLPRSVAVVGEEVVVLMIREEQRDEAFERLRELNGPVTTELGQPGLAQMYDMQRDGEDPSAIRISVTDEQFTAIRQRTLSQPLDEDPVSPARRHRVSHARKAVRIALRGRARIFLQ